MVEDGRDVLGGAGFGEVDPEQDDGLEVALTFSYEPDGLTDDLFGLSEEALFTVFEQTLEMAGVTQSVEASVLVTTDEDIRTLNRDYRGKDEATDVLSFPLLDEPLVDAPADELWQAGEDEPAPEAGAAEAAEEDDVDEDALAEDDESDAEEGWPLHLGDIAIARETVNRQAEQAGHSAAYEVAYLFVHGVLHLIGYDDQTDAGYRAMVAIQEAVLARVGIAS
jgi:probable rRNA maturation factor